MLNFQSDGRDAYMYMYAAAVRQKGSELVDLIKFNNIFTDQLQNNLSIDASSSIKSLHPMIVSAAYNVI